MAGVSAAKWLIIFQPGYHLEHFFWILVFFLRKHFVPLKKCAEYFQTLSEFFSQIHIILSNLQRSKHILKYAFEMILDPWKFWDFCSDPLKFDRKFSHPLNLGCVCEARVWSEYKNNCIWRQGRQSTILWISFYAQYVTAAIHSHTYMPSDASIEVKGIFLSLFLSRQKL